MPAWRKLLMHTAPLPDSLARLKAGRIKAAKRAIIAITTNNSINVKADVGASCPCQQDRNAAFTRQGRRKPGERATFSTSSVLPRKRGVPIATSFLHREGSGKIRPAEMRGAF